MMDAPADAELRAGLERALAEAGFELAGGIQRHPYAYRTSFPLEELQVDLVGEGPARLLFKQLDWEALDPGAQVAKPRFLHDPGREPAVYASLLPQAPPGPARFLGEIAESDRHWLFLERIEGRELFQVGERELWEEAARWLARFHVAMAPELDRHRAAGRLIDHDAAFYRGWIERAERFAAERGDGSAAKVAWLRDRHEHVVKALLALPRTVLHGEFYASNVLVSDPNCINLTTQQMIKSMQFGEGVRVAPVDWELAAVGPGVTDLGALVSGWPADDREAIAAAYAAETGVPSFTSRDLDIARLQIAIQWLGWAPPSWVPPEGQRYDWLGEAVALAEELEL
ncbi:MAG TPA: phosphotransferase [Solirubrobacterales bacterium]|nr:phosphotransferase [Solirubrobacterales bacterium]